MTDPVPFEMTRLQLVKSVFVRNASWHGPPDGRIAVATLTIRNSGGFTQKGDQAEYLMTFKTAEEGLMPFALEVGYGAHFRMTAPVPAGDRPYYVHRAFPRMVFPFMREYVAETTRRGGFPPLVINMSVSPGPRDGPPGSEADPAPVLKWIH
ncbi:MAG: protein-export chaperone SecB [Deltaproteobacteria bacterium]|jgi:hypothetical protein|nr:protein-export chaperone SecB [Deltaproteobacteria bacterium]